MSFGNKANARKAVKLEPATLIAKIEAEESKHTSSSKKSKPRRDLEAQVEKLLKDNFKGWTSRQIDCVLKDGLSLRQTLVKDKEDHHNGSITMGKNYYSAMKVKFVDVDTPSTRLKVQNVADFENPKLRAALVELIGHRGNMRPLHAFLEEDVVENQKSVVAVLRAILDIKPESGPKHTQLIIETMRWIKRNKVDVTYGNEVVSCKEHFDNALVKSFVYMKKNDVSLESWWVLHEGIVGLVANIVAFSKCLMCKSEWIEVAQELLEVVGSCGLGRVVFGPAAEALKHHRVQLTILETLKELGQTSEIITKSSLKDAKTTWVDSVKAHGIDPHENFPKRSVQVCYRGFLFDLPVNSWMEFFNLNCSAFIKGIGVERGLLEPMFVEIGLLGKRDDLQKLQVAPELLVEVATARAAASRLLDTSEDLCCDEVAKVITAKRLLLLSIDPAFKLEEGLWTALRGDIGIKLLQGRILDCLPKQDSLMSIEASIGLLEALAKAQVLSFCGRGISGQYDTVQTWLQTMRNGRCPVFGSGTEAGFMQQVQNRLNWFCIWRSSAGSSAPAQVLYGKDAVLQLVEELEIKAKDTKVKLALPDVRPLHIFAWLLTEVQKDLVQRWTDGILSSAGIANQCASKKKDEPAAKKKKVGKHAAEPVQGGVVENYFG